MFWVSWRQVVLHPGQRFHLLDKKKLVFLSGPLLLLCQKVLYSKVRDVCSRQHQMLSDAYNQFRFVESIPALHTQSALQNLQPVWLFPLVTPFQTGLFIFISMQLSPSSPSNSPQDAIILTCLFISHHHESDISRW